MDSKKKDDLNPDNLKPTFSDIVYRSSRAGLSAVPFIGSALSEILGFAVETPIEKRKTKFMLALKSEFDKLKDKGSIDVKELVNNDEFIDVFFQVYDLALKNSQQEKLDALRNAVLNTALGIDVKRDEKMMFLSIINDLTPIHLKVLDLWYHSDNTVDLILVECEKSVKGPTLPEDFGWYLKIDIKFYFVILKQLDMWNLLQHTDNRAHFGTIHNKAVREGIRTNILSAIEERRTSFGKRFLRFITKPEDSISI